MKLFFSYLIIVIFIINIFGIQNISANNEKVMYMKTMIITKGELNKTSKGRNYINQIDNIHSKIKHNENQLKNLDKRLDDLLKTNNIKNKDVLNILVYWQSIIKISLMSSNVDEKRNEVLQKDNLTTKNIYDKINIQFNDKTRYLTWNKINGAEIYGINLKEGSKDYLYYINNNENFFIPTKFYGHQNIAIIALNSNSEIIGKGILSINIGEKGVSSGDLFNDLFNNTYHIVNIIYDGKNLLSWKKIEGLNGYKLTKYEINFIKDNEVYVFNISGNDNTFNIPNYLDGNFQVILEGFNDLGGKRIEGNIDIIFQGTKNNKISISDIQNEDYKNNILSIPQKNNVNFTNLCNDIGEIIYTDKIGNEIGKVDSKGNIKSGNPDILNCEGHIIVCSGNKSGYVIQACNVGVSSKLKAGTGSENYGKYFQFGKNNNSWSSDWKNYHNIYKDDSWGVSDSIRNMATWEYSSIENKKKMQGPCSEGYHIPTGKEWTNILEAVFPDSLYLSPDISRTDLIVNILKLPIAGYRSKMNGNIFEESQRGFYWSSSGFSNTQGRVLELPIFSNNLISSERSFGMSIRCMKD